jgi:isoamylase
MGPGRSYPLGATVLPGGINFSVYSRYAKRVEILLFEDASERHPSGVVSLDCLQYRTYDYWHAFVPGLTAGQIYGFRTDGPFEPENGLRFDSGKVLLDPYGKCLAYPLEYSREAARRPGDNCATALKSVAVNTGDYDWEGDVPPRIPFSKCVIYEMHVAGFTKHPSSGVHPSLRGTFAGVIEMIPYLQDLGITAVELLPVFAFDEQDAPSQLTNYWGYSPVSFFALHPAYSSRRDVFGPMDEFRDLVKALHRAGIEIILDVVYNHTAEGGHDGPTFCFRGLANGLYYHLQENKALYADFTGTGNTVNANQSVVRRLILDSLSYWVREMHVDGFRFDLASVLSRDQKGAPTQSAPIIHDIQSDPVLSNIKLIAEAWDAAGLYQVGSFAGHQWKEWNGKFRDDIRAFVRGDAGLVRTVAFRLMGSPDVYQQGEREPERSVNFVTCHDGFTVNDLVSYNEKHNEINGEGNRDGYNQNLSWNCGVEGPTADPAIDQLRNRQVKNLLALTLLSVGTPMLLMGDEARRTQSGNNNAYCQDNELSWFDWTLLNRHGDIRRFVKKLIAFRLSHEVAVDDQGLSLIELMHRQQVQYHGVHLHAPDWSQDSRSLAFSAFSPGGRLMLYVAINAYIGALAFEIPQIVGMQGLWHRWIDTSLESPLDICSWNDTPTVSERSYVVQPRSVVALLTKTGEESE